MIQGKVKRKIYFGCCDILSFVNKFIPKNKKSILFFSTTNLYDNSEAVFKYLVDNDPQINVQPTSSRTILRPKYTESMSLLANKPSIKMPQPHTDTMWPSKTYRITGTEPIAKKTYTAEFFKSSLQAENSITITHLKQQFLFNSKLGSIFPQRAISAYAICCGGHRIRTGAVNYINHRGYAER